MINAIWYIVQMDIEKVHRTWGILLAFDMNLWTGTGNIRHEHYTWWDGPFVEMIWIVETSESTGGKYEVKSQLCRATRIRLSRKKNFLIYSDIDVYSMSFVLLNLIKKNSKSSIYKAKR